ncbi:MAG: FtsW/RodA/SpoVE family cell cycle protein [Firmicutes bacterium]|jgi:peptidoglycan glycosyltransferase|nr:FtsW/RodA/SpoVE family cell cycle protein [Bacillota bacterium]
MRSYWSGRETERCLLGIVMAIAILNGSSLALARRGTVFGAEVAVAFTAVVAFTLAHLSLGLSKCRADQVLLPLAGAAAVTGLMVVVRLRPDLGLRQVGFMWAGCAAMVLAAVWYPRLVTQHRAELASWTSLALLAATLILGAERGGARSWLVLGGLGFQPSEFAKVAAVSVGAHALSGLPSADPREVRRSPIREVWSSANVRRMAYAWGGMLALIAAQRDVGTAAVIYVACLAMVYAATGNRWLVGGMTFVGVTGVILAWVAFGHVRARFGSWLNPWADPSGSGYQVLQALFSLAGGGILGRGLGMGEPGLIPAAVTDMTFAAAAEELGLVGSAGFISIYALLVSRGLSIAMRSGSRVLALASVGAATLIGSQTFIIVGGNLGLLPLTGVTLPLVSYGGSSMITTMLLLGIILAASARRPQNWPGGWEAHGGAGGGGQ